MKKIVSILLTLAIMATMMSVAFATAEGNIPAITPTTIGGNAVSKILGAIQWVGYVFAIGMLLYIGIKYMMSAANEKADLKKGAINYVVGAVLVVGASAIFGWLAEFAEGLN